jgi:hypothetical protein
VHLNIKPISMKPVTNPSQITTDFLPEPYLPWLKTDASMQHAEAFHGVHLQCLNEHYNLMAPTFPSGCTVALTRINSADELTEGGVYWLEYSGWSAKPFGGEHMSFMGRLDHIQNRIIRRNGRDHLTMIMTDDNPTIAADKYSREEDGTVEWCMDFDEHNHLLYRITHYVQVPVALAPEFMPEMGTTLAQSRWLQEEELLAEDAAEEYTVRVLGGFPEPDFRVVLTKKPYSPSRTPGGQLQPLATILAALKPLPVIARNRKAGAIQFTIRRRGGIHHTFTHTEYYKLEEVAVAVEWLRSMARLTETATAVETELNRIQMDAELAEFRIKQHSFSETQTAPLFAAA